MNNKWRGNGYDRFGYVQRGYNNDRLYQELERSYRDWQRANRSKAKPKQAEPEPDRRILLALG